MNDNQVEFKGTVVKCVYSSPNFKTYALDVDRNKYPNIQKNRYGNTSLIGDLSDLTIDLEYDIVATEEQTKYGVSYRAVNVHRDMPTGATGTKAFLEEILTHNQAETLYANYPNILDLVMRGEDDVVDVSKLKGIGETRLLRTLSLLIS